MTISLVNNQKYYGLVSIALHWVMAVIIIGLFSLGLYMTGLDYMHPWYTDAPHVHKSIGLIFFLLLLFRTVWALANTKPDPVTMPDWERIIAAIVHKLFYFLLFGITISGYLIPTADGRGIEVFNWFEVPSLISHIENQEDIAGMVHYYLAVVTMSLTGLHTLAALKHHFVNKDATLLRMLRVNPEKIRL
jgi:cytochrome b561